MGKHLTAGQVCKIRVNPKDCMAVIDVLTAAGVRLDGMSFAAMTSLALSSLLQTMRDQKIIPTRDGFEYLDMMQPYLGKHHHHKKIQVTDALKAAGDKIQIQGISKPAADEDTPQREYVPELKSEPQSADEMRARSRLQELVQKKDMAENGDGVIWSKTDQAEYDECYAIVYPNG